MRPVVLALTDFAQNMDLRERNISITTEMTLESTSIVSNGRDISKHRTVTLEIFLWIFSASSLYIFVSLIWYENALSTRRNHTAKSRAKSVENKVARKYGLYLRIVNITAVGLLFIRTIVEHVEVLYEEFTDYDMCSKVVTLKVILAGLFITAVYLFLWLRQRMCYTNPTMNHLTTDFTHLMSRVSVVALLIAEIITVGLFVFTRSYKRSSVGCNVHKTFVPQYLVWLVYGITTATFQVTFLALFIHPLMKQRKHMKVHKGGADRAHKILPVIRRSLVACVVCVVSNLLVSVSLIFADEPYNVIPIILYNFNLQINSVALVASFSRWRFILIPCLRRKGHVSNIEAPRVLDSETYPASRDPTRQRRNLLVLLSLEPSTSIFTISTNSTLAAEAKCSLKEGKIEQGRRLKPGDSGTELDNVAKVTEENESVT